MKWNWEKITKNRTKVERKSSISKKEKERGRKMESNWNECFLERDTYVIVVAEGHVLLLRSEKEADERKSGKSQE